MIKLSISQLSSNTRPGLLKGSFILIKKIKYSFFLFFILFLISGCSSIHKIDTNKANNTVNAVDDHNFLTDIFSKLQGKTEDESEKKVINIEDLY